MQQKELVEKPRGRAAKDWKEACIHQEKPVMMRDGRVISVSMIILWPNTLFYSKIYDHFRSS